MSLSLGSCLGAALFVLIGFSGTAIGNAGVAEFLARDGQLREQLQVRDGQHGVVGESGTLWVIEPSGAFRVASFVNQKVSPPQREGSLTPEQIELLAQRLARERFSDLPRRMGDRAPANTRIISVIFGDASVALLLPPGAPLELERLVALEADAGGPEAKLLEIVDAVLEVTAAN
jgi:hypothetical protein